MTEETEKKAASRAVNLRIRGEMLEKLNASGIGPTGFFEQLFARYDLLLHFDGVIDLTDAEKQVLGNVACGSVINKAFLKYLDTEIRDGEDYENGGEAAQSLLEKVKGATIAQRLEMLESINL